MIIMFVGCVMYADDLLLLSASLCDLQLMISICYEELDELDMRLNLKKSQIVRIGRLCTSYACSVVIDGTSIEFIDELKYLGWYILSSKSFKISLHHSVFVFINVLTRCMLDVVILVNLLFSNILLTLIVNHIYYTVAMS